MTCAIKTFFKINEFNFKNKARNSQVVQMTVSSLNLKYLQLRTELCEMN